MDKYYKLAQLFKAAGKNLTRKENRSYKFYDVTYLLGHMPTDKAPERLEVENDGGFRAILLGDVRGNVSYDTGEWVDSIFHSGYAYLYTKECKYNGDRRVWQHCCYPPTEQISGMLESIAKKQPLEEVIIYKNDNGNYAKTLEYLSEVVERYANLAWEDKRSAEDIAAGTAGR